MSFRAKVESIATRLATLGENLAAIARWLFKPEQLSAFVSDEVSKETVTKPTVLRLLLGREFLPMSAEPGRRDPEGKGPDPSLFRREALRTAPCVPARGRSFLRWVLYADVLSEDNLSAGAHTPKPSFFKRLISREPLGLDSEKETEKNARPLFRWIFSRESLDGYEFDRREEPRRERRKE